MNYNDFYQVIRIKIYLPRQKGRSRTPVRNLHQCILYCRRRRLEFNKLVFDATFNLENDQ